MTLADLLERALTGHDWRIEDAHQTHWRGRRPVRRWRCRVCGEVRETDGRPAADGCPGSLGGAR